MSFYASSNVAAVLAASWWVFEIFPNRIKLAHLLETLPVVAFSQSHVYSNIICRHWEGSLARCQHGATQFRVHLHSCICLRVGLSSRLISMPKTASTPLHINFR